VLSERTIAGYKKKLSKVMPETKKIIATFILEKETC
jgi:hypothetical protein